MQDSLSLDPPTDRPLSTFSRRALAGVGLAMTALFVAMGSLVRSTLWPARRSRKNTRTPSKARPCQSSSRLGKSRSCRAKRMTKSQYGAGSLTDCADRSSRNGSTATPSGFVTVTPRCPWGPPATSAGYSKYRVI